MLNQLNTTTKRELDERFAALSNRINNYSNSEQKVGKFGDDDLYQITIDCGALPNATSKIITTDIIADNILRYDIFASINLSESNYKKQIITIPNGYVGGGDVTSVAYIDNSDKIALSISTGSDRTSFNAYATIQYTKPTQP